MAKETTYQIPVKEMCVKEAATPGLMNWKGDKGYPAFTSGVNVLGVPAMDLVAHEESMGTQEQVHIISEPWVTNLLCPAKVNPT